MMFQAVKSEEHQCQSSQKGVISIHRKLSLSPFGSGLVQKDPADSQNSTSYTALPSTLQTNLSRTDQAKCRRQKEEIPIIAKDRVAGGNLGENEPEKEAICPVPEEG